MEFKDKVNEMKSDKKMLGNKRKKSESDDDDESDDFYEDIRSELIHKFRIWSIHYD